MSIEELLSRLLHADAEYRAAMREALAHGGGIVRQARREMGLTQRQLAERLGVDHTYISKIENGAAVVSKPLLAKLARLVGGDAINDRQSRALASA